MNSDKSRGNCTLVAPLPSLEKSVEKTLFLFCPLMKYAWEGIHWLCFIFSLGLWPNASTWEGCFLLDYMDCLINNIDSAVWVCPCLLPFPLFFLLPLLFFSPRVAVSDVLIQSHTALFLFLTFLLFPLLLLYRRSLMYRHAYSSFHIIGVDRSI